VGRKKLTEPKKICALKKKVKLEKTILHQKKKGAYLKTAHAQIRQRPKGAQGLSEPVPLVGKALEASHEIRGTLGTQLHAEVVPGLLDARNAWRQLVYELHGLVAALGLAAAALAHEPAHRHLEHLLIYEWRDEDFIFL
jgi:hypothetical protein